MQNSNEIFSVALGLQRPWFVKSIEFTLNKSEKELHIYIGFTKGYKFQGEDSNSYSAYDTVERKWQHLNFFEHKCYIHCKVPRIRQEDGRVLTQAVPWSRKGSGFTLLFEAYSMLLLESEMPVCKAAKILDVYSQRIWNIFKYWVNRALEKDDLDSIKNLGIDETSVKKGHDYITLAVDIDQSKVVHVSQGKGKDTIEKCVKRLEDKKVKTDEIEQVSIDMSPAFISGCQAYIPNADIVFDKFHVVKEINKAMDELRKVERKGNELLKNHKYTFLKNKLSSEKQSERDLLLELYPKLGEGYRFVQLFKDFWNIENKEEAQGYLAFWCDLVDDSGIFPFKKAVSMIKSHWSGIINYFKSRINNGILEGINSKIQLAKRRARGYRNIDNFINMVYFICGKLNYDYPRYSI